MEGAGGGWRDEGGVVLFLNLIVKFLNSTDCS